MSVENERPQAAPAQDIESTQAEAPIAAEDAAEAPTQEQWQEALEKTVAQRDEYLSMAQRAQADFQNFKRRNANTRAEAYDEGVREALSSLLPTVDAVEMALKTARETGASGPLFEGLELIGKQLAESLAKHGLEEIPALNEPFDPELHSAVVREAGGEPGTVLEVFQKGYRAKGRILRYAMVKVAGE
jgi:molecular chaperone GrpE